MLSRRRLSAAILTALLVTAVTAAPVGSDSDLTQAVNGAYFPRAEDAALHNIAHARAVEIATDFSHNGWRDGTAEVLAWNTGQSDPIATAVSQWQGSPAHHSILSDPRYPTIGCARHDVGNVSYFACVLGFGDSPPPQVIVPVPPAEVEPAPPVLLPNTAMEAP